MVEKALAGVMRIGPRRMDCEAHLSLRRTVIRWLSLLFVLCGLMGWGCSVPPRPDLAGGASGSISNPPLKQIAPGVLKLGLVRLDKREKSIRFPAFVNQVEGPIEYLIVTSSGKTHESLLRTQTEPFHIQIALLLLGAKDAGTNSFPANETMPVPGTPILIELSWKAEGKEQQARAEEFVFNTQTKSAMSTGPWIFNGSRVVDGTFIAQEDGSIVSVMTDRDAVINNPRPGRDNDKIWEVQGKNLPPLNSPVEVTMRLVPGP